MAVAHIRRLGSIDIHSTGQRRNADECSDAFVRRGNDDLEDVLGASSGRAGKRRVGIDEQRYD